MDLLKQYLEEAVSQANGRQIGLFGFGAFGAVTFCALKALGTEPACFFDLDNSRIGGTYFGKEVRGLWEILGTDAFFVMDVFNDPEVMKRFAREHALQETVHFASLHGMFGYRKCDVADPLLIYNRVDDRMGFTFFGEESPQDDTLKIVAMGGSTSDVTFGGFASWPELLHGVLNSRGVKNTVIGAGLVGYTSAQERDKFLRDVLPLRPDIAVSLSGDNDIGYNHCDPAHNYYASYLADQFVEPVYRRCLSQNERIGYGLNREMSAAECWYRNQTVIGSVAEEFGIRYLCFLQPCIPSEGYRMSAFEQSWTQLMRRDWPNENRTTAGLFADYAGFHREAAQLIAPDANMIDLSDCFDRHSGIYLDGIHCSEEGNALIAERIADEIMQIKRGQHG